MSELFVALEALNPNTQPPDAQTMFNNWRRLPEAWYFAFRSDELRAGEVKSFQILKQRLAIFRGFDGTVRALDSFCPHMGMDLAQGKVVGPNLRCFFHHWEYDGAGRCKKIPALSDAESKTGADVGLRGYPVAEKYGLIWIYAGKSPKVPVLDVPDLEGKNVLVRLGKINRNRSHHHISMINGLDPQHLKTVHQLTLEMDVEISGGEQQVQYVLEGEVPEATRADRIMRWWIGPRYSYAMKYSQASIASLTLLRNVFFRKSEWSWPRLHMLYAYRPVQEGLCETQPIYVAENTGGLWGWLKARMKIWLTKQAYFFLKDDDDKVYDHIRFDSRRLLPMDRPIKDYIRYVNLLSESIWTEPLRGEICQERSAVTEFTADL